MKKYNRVMLGPKSIYAEECFKGNFIGADFDIKEDLTSNLFENWRDFNAHYRPIWLAANPGKSKISAGLACGMLWTICKGLNIGDIVICPDGNGNYLVGEITSNYFYAPNEILCHRRSVKWYSARIDRALMSQELKNSTGSIGTTSDITQYAEEIERLIGGNKGPILISNDSSIENPTAFALEKHLEDFLVKNWKQTILGQNYDIYSEDGEIIGKQFPSDTGPIDILAISKDKTTLLVIELKKGRVSDNVVGKFKDIWDMLRRN